MRRGAIFCVSAGVRVCVSLSISLDVCVLVDIHSRVLAFDQCYSIRLYKYTLLNQTAVKV